MKNAHSQTRPWHLWLIGILALLWNGFAAVDFTGTTFFTDAWLGAMGFDASQIAFFESLPFWQSIAWALGAWGGFWGAITLLLRSAITSWLWLVSLMGAVASKIGMRTIEVPESLNPGILAYVIIGIATLLLIYAIRMRKRGILK